MIDIVAVACPSVRPSFRSAVRPVHLSTNTTNLPTNPSNVPVRTYILYVRTYIRGLYNNHTKYSTGDSRDRAFYFSLFYKTHDHDDDDDTMTTI